jgi:hypothetical protein
VKALVLSAILLLTGGCTVGEGEGWVRSDRLYIDECWDGAFDLGPDFFAANPYRRETLMIRVQRGDNAQEFSDGLSVLVPDLNAVRDRLGEDIPVGLPLGIDTPVGDAPIMDGGTAPPVSLAVYLHNSCHVRSGTVYSIEGSIRFESLFSGDPGEADADDRLTDATFDAVFADPRELAGEDGDDPRYRSQVSGAFRFFFQRGQPAQPFTP